MLANRCTLLVKRAMASHLSDRDLRLDAIVESVGGRLWIGVSK